MADINDLRCIHRHTIFEHPACFAKGLVKDAGEKPWYEETDLKIGYFDIETDNLNADWGSVLTWCIKERGGVVHSDVITKKDLFDKNVRDSKIIKSLIKEMENYDVIVTYYGSLFDVPYVRAKALHYDLDFPEFSDIYHWDLYFSCKSLLKISSKSLANVCDYLHIEGKTPISKDVWRDAKYGDPDALKDVLDHNIGDVEILEQLHNKIVKFRKWTRKSI